MTYLPQVSAIAIPDLAGSLALELHDTLRQLDPARWRAEKAQAMRDRLSSLKERFDALRARRAEQKALRVQELAAEVAMQLEQPAPHDDADVTHWVQYRAQVSPAYEALVSELKGHQIRVPSLRPTNYRRSIGHAIAGTIVLAIVELVPREYLVYPAFGAFLSVWVTEAMRRVSPAWNERVMRLFNPIAHAYEVHGINSGTWYVTALMVLALLQNPLVGAVGVAILAYAGPAAALVGRRYGSIPLVGGRSLQGSLTFAAVGFVVATAVMMLFHHAELTLMHALVVAVVASISGALAELFSGRIDDNLSIPIVAASMALLVL